MFIGSYYAWNNINPTDTVDGPVVLIVNFNQCSGNAVFNWHTRLAGLSR